MGEASTLHDSARMIFASGMLTGLSVAAASWPFEKKMQVALNIFQRSSSGQISQCFRLGVWITAPQDAVTCGTASLAARQTGP